METKSQQNKVIGILNLCIFGVLTLYIMLNRIPFWDEAHSWMIAKSFSFWELISQVERMDGHLFMWHLLQMPFAKNDFYYPYPSYIMNWLFCMGALIIFWKNAPFKNIEKFFITFSTPFVFYFAPIARCYSLGILFLFIILSLWKEKLKYPILVPFLIICFANTSVMALAATVPLGLIYVYDLIKNKQKFIMSFLIFSFGAFLVLFQLFGAHLANSNYRYFISSVFLPFFIYHPFENIGSIVWSAFVVFLCIASCLFFCLSKKYKSACFFLITTYGIMITIFSTSYIGSWWHYFQFFIYYISAVWIMRLENNYKDNFHIRLFNLLFLLTLILYSISGIFSYNELKNTLPYISKSKFISEDMQKHGLFNEKNKIFTLDYFSDTSVGMLPYLKTDTYNIFGDKKYSIRGIQNYYQDQFSNKYFDTFAEKLDNTKTNIAITSAYLKEGVLCGEKHKIIFELIHKNEDLRYYVYEIRAK